ncbi:unnamed protein product [Paramecium sonneborni]|uniref:Uncharacterized protein n=1 Tax=Paramecium sonneborni TaxID=65129 RepID=A0A8S1PAG2_9CILI|nr:unnamed protein product [Paramecium sonneborni]
MNYLKLLKIHNKLEFIFFEKVQVQKILTLPKSDIEFPSKYENRSIYDCFEDIVHKEKLNDCWIEEIKWKSTLNYIVERQALRYLYLTQSYEALKLSTKYDYYENLKF